MAEGLEEVWKKLSLTDKEERVVGADIEEDQKTKDRISLMLIGKVLTTKPFNVEAMRRTLRSVWNPKGGVAIRELEPNLFVFQFFNREDKERVEKGRPWTFDFNLVMLQELKGDESPSDVQFRFTPMWINVYDASLAKRNFNMAKAIGDHIGEFMEFDESDELALNRAMRIKVKIDVTCPLVRGMKIATRDSWKWVKIKYERLPNFCYACGAIGHTQKECDKVEEEGLDSITNQYGPWMRASPLKEKPRMSKKETEYEKEWLRKRQLKEQKMNISPNQKEIVTTKRNIIFEDQVMNVESEGIQNETHAEQSYLKGYAQIGNVEEYAVGLKMITEEARTLDQTLFGSSSREELARSKNAGKSSKFKRIERSKDINNQEPEGNSLGEKRKNPAEDEDGEDLMKIDDLKRCKMDDRVSRAPFLLQVAEVETTQPREQP